MTEADIRRAVIAQLAQSPSGRDAAFISEMFLDKFARRADLVMANGKLCAFEIKSGLDSLDRLDGQLASYLRFFEQVTVVCAVKHLAAVTERAHESVGIWSVSKEGRIAVVRRAKTQPSLSKHSWLSFLPVDELKLYLRQAGAPAVGARADLLAAAQQTTVTAIRAYVLAFLKRRDIRIEERIAVQAKKRLQVVATVPAQVPHADRLAAFIRTHQHSASQVAIPRRVS